MNFVQRIFRTSRGTKLFGILLLLILVGILPLILVTLKQQQDIRQRATGTNPQASLYYAVDDSNTNPPPISSSVTVSPGQTVSLRLFLNTGSIPIDVFDITVQFGNGLTLTSVNSGTGADRFASQVFGPPDTIDNQNRRFRYFKTTTDPNANISGVLYLGKLNFTASSTTGTGTITFGTVEIAGSGVVLDPVDKPTLGYVIAQVAATNTPTPGPSPTPTIAPTGVPTLTPLAADVDRNGCVGIADYNKWAQTFQTGVVQQGTFPDINIDGQVDLLDFNQWYNAMLSLPQSRRCE